MNKNSQPNRFEQVAADPGRHWREDGWDALTSWESLPAESKVPWLATYAAIYGATFERFEKAVRDAFGGHDVPLKEGYTLRGHFDGAMALYGPDRNYGSATYLDTLNRYAVRSANHPEKDRGIEH